MFRDTRRKKLRNRAVFLAMAAIVLAFGLWLNFRTESDTDNYDTARAVDAETEKKASDVKETESGTDTVIQPETYLIKEVDGVVKVFLCDNEDNKELYLITSIPYDLLSESDQQMFTEGVKIETEDDLGAFLQNFDS